MIQTLLVKLDPSPDQYSFLIQTMIRFNEACNYISKIAYENHTSSAVKLHHICYYDTKSKFNFTSQMVVRAVGKVSETYRKNKNKLHHFQKYSAVVYDNKNLSWKGLDYVSILTINGREKIPVRIGDYAEPRINRVIKQTDLILKNKVFYLAVTIDAPEPTPDDPVGSIGVDLGIVHLAVDSDGNIYSGKKIDSVREKIEKLKANLQKAGSKSAKKHLKKLSGKESRFRKDINHIISKQIVFRAKGTHRSIALENLKGITKKTTVRKAQRRRHNSWAFYQLRRFIEYKAKMAGVIVQLVDPRNTSRTCPECGFVSKENRKTQSDFHCIKCGFRLNADLVGAINIASRAVIGQPIVSA